MKDRTLPLIYTDRSVIKRLIWRNGISARTCLLGHIAISVQKEKFYCQGVWVLILVNGTWFWFWSLEPDSITWKKIRENFMVREELRWASKRIILLWSGTEMCGDSISKEKFCTLFRTKKSFHHENEANKTSGKFIFPTEIGDNARLGGASLSQPPPFYSPCLLTFYSKNWMTLDVCIGIIETDCIFWSLYAFI